MDLSALIPGIKVFYDEALSNYTYTKTGGKADILVFPQTIEQIIQVVELTHNEKMPLTILGNASNLIVRDGGIRGLVMILTDLKNIELSGVDRVVSQAGAGLIQVSRFARDQQLTGLEFACGIPGSVGGAVFMNAGAYGGEVKDCIESVQTISRQGELKTYRGEECAFSYRHSCFQDNDEIVVSATFKLAKGNPEEIQAQMNHLTELRESKQPLEYPSCGSVFKRPEGHYTGQLIQEAGLQGYRMGGAEVSKKHAGFIVNIDNATATDYTQLIAYIQAKIWDKFQVKLETEVRIIGHEVEKCE